MSSCKICILYIDIFWCFLFCKFVQLLTSGPLLMRWLSLLNHGAESTTKSRRSSTCRCSILNITWIFNLSSKLSSYWIQVFEFAVAGWSNTVCSDCDGGDQHCGREQHPLPPPQVGRQVWTGWVKTTLLISFTTGKFSYIQIITLICQAIGWFQSVWSQNLWCQPSDTFSNITKTIANWNINGALMKCPAVF